MGFGTRGSWTSYSTFQSPSSFVKPGRAAVRSACAEDPSRMQGAGVPSSGCMVDSPGKPWTVMMPLRW